MFNKIIFLIIIKFLVILNFSLTATYADDFKYKKHVQQLVSEFFSDSEIGSCANSEQISIECKKILTDAITIAGIGNSFYLTHWYEDYVELAKSNYRSFDTMQGFQRSKLQSHLLKLPKIFACIEAGCGLYSMLTKEKRLMSIKGHKDAIVYIECLLKTDEISFGRQALASWSYYHQNPIGYETLVSRVNLNQYFHKPHDFLFMEHDQFKECAALNTPRDALNLIIRSGSKLRPGTF